MIVYRIENDRGLGPYEEAYLMQFHHEFFRDEDDENRWFLSHPSPWKDPRSLQRVFKDNNYYNFSKYHCGFSTIKQMKAWFDKDNYFHWLHEHGFKLVVYRGPARYGEYQAIVKKSEAVKIREVSLLNYTN